MREPALHSTPGGQRTVSWIRGAATRATSPGSGFPALPARSPEVAGLEGPVQLRTAMLRGTSGHRPFSRWQHTPSTPKVEWPQAKPSRSRCRTPGQSGQVGMSRSTLWGTGRASKREPRGRGARRGSSGKFRDQGCVRPRTTHTLGGSRAPPEPGQGVGGPLAGQPGVGAVNPCESKTGPDHRGPLAAPR